MTEKEIENHLNHLRHNSVRICNVGSRVTCNPPPTDTDIDFLALLPDSVPWSAVCPTEKGWVLGGSQDPFSGSEFASFTLKEINVILTYDQQFFDKFMAATSVAKRLNIVKKDDRIALFRAVIYSIVDG